MKNYWKLKLFLCFFGALLSPNGAFAAASLVLSPDAVIDRVLAKNLRAKRFRLDAERAKLAIGQAEGVFDWALESSYSFTVDKSESFSSFENPKDEYSEWTLGVSKKLPTGTSLGLAFSRLGQDSTLSTAALAFGTLPEQTKDELSFTLKQELVKNAFGIVDRYLIHTAKLGEASARFEATEQIEGLVVQSLTRYWQAFAAKERIRDAKLAKDKYGELIRTLKRKRKLGVASVAELRRAEAEFWTQEQNVLRSTVAFSNLKSEIFEDLQIDPDTELQFSVIVDLPPLPNREEPAIEESRTIRAAANIVEKRSWEKRAADLQTLPELNLVASYKMTGVDASSGESFSEMWGGDKPTYAIGIELKWLFASNLQAAEKAFAETQFIDADTELHRRRINLHQSWKRLRQECEQNRAVAEASIKEVELRQRVIRDQELSFRQGRIDSSQLIIDYNALYRAQSTSTEAVGNYRVSLAKLAAIEDRLIPSSKD